MSYPQTPLRYARKTGHRPEATAMWDGECTTERGNPSPLHIARRPYAQDHVGDDIPDGWTDVAIDRCDRCGAPAPGDDDLKRSGSLRWTWDTPSGALEPGCVYTTVCPHPKGAPVCPSRWSNCSGAHVHVMLPNGISWDVMGRANNCGSPDDTTHRCWVLVGDPTQPETLHVSKDGETCAAGAGSIAAGDYHGFLQHGILTAG